MPGTVRAARGARGGRRDKRGKGRGRVGEKGRRARSHGTCVLIRMASYCTNVGPPPPRPERGDFQPDRRRLLLSRPTAQRPSCDPPAGAPRPSSDATTTPRTVRARGRPARTAASGDLEETYTAAARVLPALCGPVRRPRAASTTPASPMPPPERERSLRRRDPSSRRIPGEARRRARVGRVLRQCAQPVARGGAGS